MTSEQKYIRPDMTVIMDQLKRLEINDRKLRIEVERLHERNHKLEAKLERLDVLYIEQHHYFKRITQTRKDNGNAIKGVPVTDSLYDSKRNGTYIDNTDVSFEMGTAKGRNGEDHNKRAHAGTNNPAFQGSFDDEQISSKASAANKETGRSNEDKELAQFPTSTQSKSTISKTKVNYREALKIPGLRRTFTGHIIEKITWSLLLAGALGLAVYFVWEIWHQFGRKELMSHVQHIDTNKYALPSITVCHDNIFLRNLQCYNNTTASGETCANDALRPALIVKNCQFRGISCADSITMSPWEPGCITINQNGSMFQEGIIRLAEFVVVLQDNGEQSRTYTVFLHNSTEKPTTLHGFGKIKLYAGEFELSLEQHIYDRYGTECISNEEIYDNLFPGKYTRYGCLDTCWMQQLFTTCGAVPDVWTPYVPKSMMAANKGNGTDAEKRQCITKQLETVLTAGAPNCECKNACYENRFKATIKQLNVNAGGDLTLQISYSSLSYTHIKNRPIYSSAKLLSDIGGIFALFLGASFLAVIEILVYLGLLVASKFSH